jgi:hypothetical protein
MTAPDVPDVPEEPDWPTHCPICGTELAPAVVDFDRTNANHAERRPGEMVAVDFCPNPDCPGKQPEAPGTA